MPVHPAASMAPVSPAAHPGCAPDDCCTISRIISSRVSRRRCCRCRRRRCAVFNDSRNEDSPWWVTKWHVRSNLLNNRSFSTALFPLQVTEAPNGRSASASPHGVQARPDPRRPPPPPPPPAHPAPAVSSERVSQLRTGGGGGGGGGKRMKRGSSVLPRAAGGEDEEGGATGPSPPSATSLFSPDVGSKMASDLLIRLSEATQKARAPPGGGVEPRPRRQEARGGQQDEPGLALSPDGPGASPEPPSLSHTPESNCASEILASDLLRKLAERQEMNSQSVRVKEEEEPMEVDSLAAFDLSRNNRPIAEQLSLCPPPPPPPINRKLFNIKTEESETKTQAGAKMSDRRVFDLGGLYRRESAFDVQVKREDGGGGGGAVTVEQLLSGARTDCLPKAKAPEQHLNVEKKRNSRASGVDLSRYVASGARASDLLPIKTEELLFFGAKMEEQFAAGPKMADQCLRAVLWQDMSVNLASTLLHQLSERVVKSSTQMVERTPTPVRTSPPLALKVEQNCSTPSLATSQPLPETSLRRDQSTGGTYFYRCHVCGFETEGRSLFHSHMTEHRQWERDLFSLHCCVCDLSTNQEPEMTAHVDTHLHRDAHARAQIRCPPTSPVVAVVTAPETSAHRCRICQRSFPGQQELLVHFQGHRQGNQYRCDRCGHLTRTANKLVEHVRVHTGERPFTCTLCPYSAKRRDSLRLHCKVKHPTAVHALTAHVHANGLVHAAGHVHRDDQRAHTQRLHTSLSLPPQSPPLWDRPLWRELSPLLPITVLLNIRPRPSDQPDQSEPRPSDQSEPRPADLSHQSEPSCPAVASSSKQSYMCYLGLASL
ncbi:uncharacterized protein [Eucyclogobius newberryi]|uniref:uncharacterized protein n=1 Tax=Eucyclogobius newberryi TaxID=166745 RepID=UPI003B5ACC24